MPRSPALRGGGPRYIGAEQEKKMTLDNREIIKALGTSREKSEGTAFLLFILKLCAGVTFSAFVILAAYVALVAFGE